MRPLNNVGLALLAPAVAALGACEREPAASSSSARPRSDADYRVAAEIDFPESVQADDPAVNDFVRQAIDTCVSGDYERFRLLWNVREDPFPRGEFERGWKAVRKVTVLDVQKLRNPPQGAAYEGKYLYYLHGRVELDETVPEPVREVLLLVVQEGEHWRLAKAPKNLRERVLGRQDGGQDSADSRSPSGSG